MRNDEFEEKDAARLFQIADVTSALPAKSNMMVDVKQLEVQYVTNQAGERTAVIMTMANFGSLLEDLEDLAAIAERRNGPTIMHDTLLVELKQNDVARISRGSGPTL